MSAIDDGGAACASKLKMNGDGLDKGSLHVLRNASTELVFEWTGQAWSTPGTGYGTRPAYMRSLGWSYKQPVETKEVR